MVAELIPVIDLRYLSQSELTTLALSSPNAFDLRRCDDIIVPKIDRSVFNESAGSRKQTYSRLRLAPPKPDSPSLPRRRGRPRSIPLHTASSTTTPSASAPPASDDNSKDPDRRENVLIASFLRQLFSREDPSSQTLTLNKAVSTECVNENNDGWKNILAAAEEAQKALVLAEDRDRETLNSKGVDVDLVALGQMEDPFGEELRRRSLGLKTEEQLIGFLSSVEGQWASRRKRRRFVDASHFGDVLPKSWKLLLGLKRKEGVAWLDCRRYVSPNGHQFMSCKEVSSYILSLQQGAIPPISKQDDNDTPQFDKVTPGSNAGQNHQSSISNGNSVFSPSMPASHISGNEDRQPEGTSYYHATPISYIPCDNVKQHLLSSQQRRAKRRKLGKTIVDGVILKDGKFECQFCHKVFNERHRYNGHIGAHVRYQGLTADAVVDESSTKKISGQSSWAVVPYNSSNKEVSTMKSDVSQTIECITQPSSPQDIGGKIEISAAKSADSGHLEGIIEEGVVTEIKFNDCADNTLPSASDLNATPQDCSPMITEEASPSKPVGDEVCDPQIDTFPKRLEDALCNLSNEIDSRSSVSKAIDANSPNMENPDPAACNADDVLNALSIGRTFDGISMAALDAGNIAHIAINGSDLPYSPSKAEVLDRNDCNSINYTAHKSACNSDYMDADTNTCYDLSLSLMDMDAKAKDKHNGINPSPCNLSSEFENYNDKLMVEIENHSFSLSGNQLSNECLVYSDISAHAVEEDVQKSKSKEGRDASEYFHQIFDKDVLDGGMPGTLQNSSTFSSFSSEQMRDLSANTDCPFSTDINECVLQDIDKPINELEFFFGGSNSVHEGNAANEMIENDVESEAVHISLSNSSWLQSTNALPVLDMLPDQCGSELGEISRKSENLQAFEELRLGTISPSDFALFTGHDSRTVVEPSISLGYSSELDEQHCSSFQLGWNISLGNMDNTNSFTSVCVWCSTEFRNENNSDEPNSETLGFICPSCKAKFSGP